MTPANLKRDIRDLSYDEFAEYLISINEKPFRAQQVFEWIYKKGVWSFADMKNLSQDLRKKLAEDFEFKPLKIVTKQIAEDGTTKFLFELDDHEKI